ncbi:MAG: hypothetical protein WCK42_10375, partial [Myxococcaceae bacterium]
IKTSLPRMSPKERISKVTVAVPEPTKATSLEHLQTEATLEVAEIERLKLAYGLLREAQISHAGITQEQDQALLKKLQERSVEISQAELKSLREANKRSDTFKKSDDLASAGSQKAQVELSGLNKFLQEPPRKYPDKIAEQVVQELQTLGLTVPNLEEIVGNWKFFNDAREKNLNIHPDDIETDKNTTQLSQQILAEVNSKRKAPLKEFSELFKHQIDADDELKRKTQIAEKSLAAIRENRKQLEEALYSRINPRSDPSNPNTRLLSNQESLALFEKFKKAA